MLHAVLLLQCLHLVLVADLCNTTLSCCSLHPLQYLHNELQERYDGWDLEQLLTVAPQGLNRVFRPMCPECQGGSKQENCFAVTVTADSHTGKPEAVLWHCHRGKCGFHGGLSIWGEMRTPVQAGQPSGSFSPVLLPDKQPQLAQELQARQQQQLQQAWQQLMPQQQQQQPVPQSPQQALQQLLPQRQPAAGRSLVPVLPQVGDRWGCRAIADIGLSLQGGCVPALVHHEQQRTVLVHQPLNVAAFRQSKMSAAVVAESRCVSS